ncbi:MAG: SPASM domain-containing protein, partial [Dictyoglomus sp.]
SLYEALMEIEDNPIYKSLKERYKVCENCEIVEACKGGCYARAYLLEGNIDKPDPFCPKTLTLSKI